MVKADMEGAEPDALRMCEELFRERRVKYCLVEVSPCFHDRYAEAINNVMRCGYSAHKAPDKTHPRVAEFSADPIGETLSRSIIDVESYMKEIHQENWLLVRA